MDGINGGTFQLVQATYVSSHVVLQDAGATTDILRTCFESTVWDNSVKGNVHKIAVVQRRVARFTCRYYRRTSSVSVMLQKLKWDTRYPAATCS